MDFTPLINPTVWNANQSADTKVTTGFLLALPVVQEGGMMCYADLAENYHQAGLYDFFKNIPNTWDDSKLLAGTPATLVTTGSGSSITSSVAEGASAVVARRKGVNWYVGGISVSAQPEYKLSLDFLGDGVYAADIYTDVDQTTFGVNTATKLVTRADVLALSLLDRGGFAVKLTKVNGKFESALVGAKYVSRITDVGNEGAVSGTAILAIYDKNGVLAYSEAGSLNAPAGATGAYTFNVNPVLYPRDQYNVTAYFWDESFVPLTAAISD
jgi:hypothetical protein